jgi:hypothetical protein
MTELRCARVSRGLREADAIATLRDVYGRQHFLQIEKDFLAHHDSSAYLPVAFVARDRTTGAILVELPHEAETGVNRLWVAADDLRDGTEVGS